ncbi:hypothetical protein [Brevundimonas lenta]|uniref:Uncharacterized protein n=1 Tax=Brevundimonas lenta TaxID=424796 RepID=A0A7W6JHQ7_9CAUL|nr:hypothetical protein [Brevundimonas lenta]MBB4084346.1 hypothetical protein [Brevundimonas lenta]
MTFNNNMVSQRPMVEVPEDLASRDVYDGMTLPLFSVYRQIVAAGGRMIERKTFRNCVIEGPAVLLATGGVQFHNCNMGESGGDIRNLLLRPVGPKQVVGTIAVADTVFENCRFFGVGFTGGAAFLDQFLQGIGPSRP